MALFAELSPFSDKQSLLLIKKERVGISLNADLHLVGVLSSLKHEILQFQHAIFDPPFQKSLLSLVATSFFFLSFNEYLQIETDLKPISINIFFTTNLIVFLYKDIYETRKFSTKDLIFR